MKSLLKKKNKFFTVAGVALFAGLLVFNLAVNTGAFVSGQDDSVSLTDIIKSAKAGGADDET